MRRDRTPTAILRDLVKTASKLYFDGKVDKILMSGDNRFQNYNEPESMRQDALAPGVPDAPGTDQPGRCAITLDYAGRRTCDTCYQATTVFKVDSALLVTQRFHLPRALFLCNAFGLNAYGMGLC